MHADCNSLILVRNLVIRALYRSLDGSAIGVLAALHGLSSVPSIRIWRVTLPVIQAPWDPTSSSDLLRATAHMQKKPMQHIKQNLL